LQMTDPPMGKVDSTNDSAVICEAMSDVVGLLEATVPPPSIDRTTGKEQARTFKRKHGLMLPEDWRMEIAQDGMNAADNGFKLVKIASATSVIPEKEEGEISNESLTSGREEKKESLTSGKEEQKERSSAVGERRAHSDREEKKERSSVAGERGVQSGREEKNERSTVAGEERGVRNSQMPRRYSLSSARDDRSRSDSREEPPRKKSSSQNSTMTDSRRDRNGWRSERFDRRGERERSERSRGRRDRDSSSSHRRYSTTRDRTPPPLFTLPQRSTKTDTPSTPTLSTPTVPTVSTPTVSTPITPITPVSRSTQPRPMPSVVSTRSTTATVEPNALPVSRSSRHKLNWKEAGASLKGAKDGGSERLRSRSPLKSAPIRDKVDKGDRYRAPISPRGENRLKGGEKEKENTVVPLTVPDNEGKKPLFDYTLLGFSLPFRSHYETIIDHFKKIMATVIVTRTPTICRSGCAVLKFQTNLEALTALQMDPVTIVDKRINLTSPGQIAFKMSNEVDEFKLETEIEIKFGPVAEMLIRPCDKSGLVRFIDRHDAVHALKMGLYDCRSQSCTVIFEEADPYLYSSCPQWPVRDRRWEQHREIMVKARKAEIAINDGPKIDWTDEEKLQLIDDQSSSGRVTLVGGPITQEHDLRATEKYFEKFRGTVELVDCPTLSESDPGTIRIVVPTIEAPKILAVAAHDIGGYQLCVGLPSPIDITTTPMDLQALRRLVRHLHKEFGAVAGFRCVSEQAELEGCAKYRITFMHLQSAIRALSTLSHMVGQPLGRESNRFQLRTVKRYAFQRGL
ncbi:hypothetical protein PFISCL1PPCAC_23436, partial [Pristionchus fissidentatus]